MDQFFLIILSQGNHSLKLKPIILASWLMSSTQTKWKHHEGKILLCLIFLIFILWYQISWLTWNICSMIFVPCEPLDCSVHIWYQYLPVFSKELFFAWNAKGIFRFSSIDLFWVDFGNSLDSCEMYNGGTIKFSPGNVTWINRISNCRLKEW